MKKKTYEVLFIDPYYYKYSNDLPVLLNDCEFIFMPDHQMGCEYFYHNNVDLTILNHDNDFLCIKTLQFFKSLKPLVPVIIMTDQGSEDFAVAVFRSGAKDYIKRPFAMDKLLESIQIALGIVYKKNDRTDSVLVAFDCIHKYYNTRLRLDDIARETGMSISSFERKFKEKTGITFTSYLNNYRVTKAGQLLKHDGLSMNDIAFACGFSNQFHFTRTFKKINKISPIVYKKSLKSKHRKKKPLYKIRKRSKNKQNMSRI